jgi:ribosome-binding protein aMBF1 (putative translation factor)
LRQTRASFQKQEHQRLREILAKARAASGLSARAFSIKFGRQPTFMARVERGERLLEVVEFIEMCRLLELDAAAVIRKISEADSC